MAAAVVVAVGVILSVADLLAASAPGGPAARIQVRDFGFVPETVEASAGQRVTMSVANFGRSHHTFTVPALGVDLVLAPGDETTVDLSAPEEGEVDILCRFHQASGMRGRLLVRPA